MMLVGKIEKLNLEIFNSIQDTMIQILISQIFCINFHHIYFVTVPYEHLRNSTIFTVGSKEEKTLSLTPSPQNRRYDEHSTERKTLAWDYEEYLVCILSTHSGVIQTG
ncbi:hypothetical protein A9Z39_23580 [Paenibacillus polymyxa]|nr:hypothetical protein A9Z39_23580 [Paenibacillus polymyxa]